MIYLMKAFAFDLMSSHGVVLPLRHTEIVPPLFWVRRSHVTQLYAEWFKGKCTHAAVAVLTVGLISF
jgi:hypothetical protein